MTNVAKRLEELKKEKERLSEISRKIGGQAKKKRFLFFGSKESEKKPIVHEEKKIISEKERKPEIKEPAHAMHILKKEESKPVLHAIEKSSVKPNSPKEEIKLKEPNVVSVKQAAPLEKKEDISLAVQPKEAQKEHPKIEKKAQEAKSSEKHAAKKDVNEETFKIVQKEKKKRISSYEQKRRFSNYIKKAGVEAEFSEINKKIVYASIIPISLACAYFIVDSFLNKSFLLDALSLVASLFIFGSIALYLILWVSFFFYIDFKNFQRKKEIEAVFPDFLQLTAANINAGLPIDRALWFAIRPRFGILAKEMELAAKATMVGEDLKKALVDFSNKYDSITIKRAMNLLLEGLESGGEIGDLLTRISTNMRETEIIKKEMSSNVTTYVIFILFATLGAAPFLFGLTTELIVIMSSILSSIDVGGTSQGGGIGGMISISGGTISLRDYQIFALASICISSIFAAIIISVIQKGNAKESVKQIPIYIIIGLVNYFISFTALNYLLGGFFK